MLAFILFFWKLSTRVLPRYHETVQLGYLSRLANQEDMSKVLCVPSLGKLFYVDERLHALHSTLRLIYTIVPTEQNWCFVRPVPASPPIAPAFPCVPGSHVQQPKEQKRTLTTPAYEDRRGERKTKRLEHAKNRNSLLSRDIYIQKL
jgi:hypothetical protein